MWQRVQHARNKLSHQQGGRKEGEGRGKISESVEGDNTVVNGHLARERARGIA